MPKEAFRKAPQLRKGADAFISGAAVSKETPPVHGGDVEVAYRPRSYQQSAQSIPPWEAAHVRPNGRKVFNLRLPEPLFERLDYLSKRTGASKHKILMDLLESPLIREADQQWKEEL